MGELGSTVQSWMLFPIKCYYDIYPGFILLLYLHFRTEIEWHPGKCLTQKILKKKPKKGSKNAKPITKTEQCESFFNFFSPPQVPEDDEDIDEDAVSSISLWL